MNVRGQSGEGGCEDQSNPANIRKKCAHSNFTFLLGPKNVKSTDRKGKVNCVKFKTMYTLTSIIS